MLTDTDKAILEFESRRYVQSGAKEAAIRDELGISSVRYYQLLNRLIDSPDAVRHSPLVVNRVRRLRAQRLR